MGNALHEKLVKICVCREKGEMKRESSPLCWVKKEVIKGTNTISKYEAWTLGCSDFNNSMIRIVEKVQNKSLRPCLYKSIFQYFVPQLPNFTQKFAKSNKSKKNS